MNTAQMIAELHAACGPNVQVRERVKLLGFIPWTRKRGWLWIVDEGDVWAVWRTTGRDTHNRWHGPALCVEYDKGSGGAAITAWRQVIVMWPVRDAAAASAVFADVRTAIELAWRENVISGEALEAGRRVLECGRQERAE